LRSMTAAKAVDDPTWAAHQVSGSRSRLRPP